MKHIDPVCGMVVKEEESLSFEYEGKKYYFCSQVCYEKFKEDPKKYLDPNYKKEMKRE